MDFMSRMKTVYKDEPIIIIYLINIFGSGSMGMMIMRYANLRKS